jgi:hypothetical protein
LHRLLFRTVHDIMLMLDREQHGREANPKAGVVDSQAVKALADGAYDRGRLASLAAYKDFTLEIVRKLPDQKGFPGAAATLGGGTLLRLDDALAPAGARLRGAPGRVRRHDPPQHGRAPAPARRSPRHVAILTRALSCTRSSLQP